MRILISLLILFSLSSCYTKKRAIEKFCSQDSNIVIINHIDTFLVKETKHDTTFSIQVDSVFIQKDKLQIVYKRIKDSIFIEGKCIADTIIKIKPITLKVPCNCKSCELVWWRKWFNYIAYFFALLWIFGYLSRRFERAQK